MHKSAVRQVLVRSKRKLVRVISPPSLRPELAGRLVQSSLLVMMFNEVYSSYDERLRADEFARGAPDVLMLADSSPRFSVRAR